MPDGTLTIEFKDAATRKRWLSTQVEGDDGEGWCEMGGKADQAKGRAKEAAGIVIGDQDLEAEGKADRRTGEAEEKVDHAKDKVDEVIDNATAKVEQAADKAKDALDRK